MHWPRLRRRKVEDPDRWHSTHRGYELRRRGTVDEGFWEAFHGGHGPCWFRAPTEEALKKELDEALDSVPPPVY